MPIVSLFQWRSYTGARAPPSEACALPSAFQARSSAKVLTHIIRRHDQSYHYPVNFNTKLATVATIIFPVLNHI